MIVTESPSWVKRAILSVVNPGSQSTGCAYRKSSPSILVVQSTEDRTAQNAMPRRHVTPPPHHVFGHAGLADIDAKLEKLAMDPRCSPQRIGNAHLTDELAYFERHLRPAATASRPQAPVQPETSAMPANNGVRLHDRQRIANVWKKPVETNEYQAIEDAERGSLRSNPPQNVDLLAQCPNLCFERCPRPKSIDSRPTNEPEKIPHYTTAPPDSRSNANRIRFPTRTSIFCGQTAVACEEIPEAQAFGPRYDRLLAQRQASERALYPTQKASLWLLCQIVPKPAQIRVFLLRFIVLDHGSDLLSRAIAHEIVAYVGLDCLCRCDIGVAASFVAVLELGKPAPIKRTR
jgi:hypothetical protein